MDREPDILSSGPRERGHRLPRWPWPERAGLVTMLALGVLVACLGGLAYLGLALAHRDNTIGRLRADLQVARNAASSAAARPGLPSRTEILTFPDKSGGSFSMVVAASHDRPRSEAVSWLFLYGQHAQPGERYGLLGGTCGGQYVAPVDWADGTADGRGDLTIVVPDPPITPRDPNLWILVYQQQDGETLGGIKGPLIGGGDKSFASSPPC